ncbi:acyltransferase [Ferruginibacter sp. HRS2-29]|uniref:acyltransferase family protein n=1 Tax=Ferruginibacter sp. HRS2-29 TaxID=2487334 RepID=UPI0020CF44A9|nr:acyltransferase [Ferruginibacter sp. HRS2-29]MCP9751924.1 acyltransferase [Ferruginibacter sp. HRS2-29]
MTKPTKKIAYIPQLDNLRFFAVLLVIIYHWAPGNIVNTIPNGFIGVTFFFVISGFLISSNLFITRQLFQERKVTFWHALKIFYYRRSLRIFPLYFLVIFLVYFLNKNIFNGHFFYYLTYTSNFLIFEEKKWAGGLSHFWSLAVEEQFYLVWPFIILFLKRRWLKYVLPGIVIASIVFKFIFSRTGYLEVLPVSCFDAFGIGAILAYRMDLKELPVNSGSGKRWTTFLIVFFITILAGYFKIGFILGVLISILSALIIFFSKEYSGGWASFFLQNRMIRYLGKISYGLYVYHNFVPWLVRCISGKETEFPINVPVLIPAAAIANPYVAMGLHLALLVGIASLSWFIFEKPLNDLKVYLK